MYILLSLIIFYLIIFYLIYLFSWYVLYTLFFFTTCDIIIGIFIFVFLVIFINISRNIMGDFFFGIKNYIYLKFIFLYKLNLNLLYDYYSMINLFIMVFNNKFGILYSFYINLYLKDVINISMFRNYFDQLLKDFSLFFKFKFLLAETLLVDLSRFYLTVNCLKKNLFMVLLLKSLVFDDVCVYRLGTGKWEWDGLTFIFIKLISAKN